MLRPTMVLSREQVDAITSAANHWPPSLRADFYRRVVAILQRHADPGPGDLHRAIAAAQHAMRSARSSWNSRE
jgi:hypothetical protein